MTPIDFTDLDDDVGLSATPLSVAINDLIEQTAALEPPRGYLGASAVGHHCARQIQLDWWCKPLLADRIRLVFDRGHWFESEARRRLLAAGFAFAPPEALEFIALDGFLRGHADGLLLAGPLLPNIHLDYPALWECKCLNAKNFRAVERDGIEKPFPRYAVQARLYQRYLDKTNPALFTVINADDCRMMHFVLSYDAAAAERATERAREVIEATRRGDLLPRFTTDPDDWRCRTCPHREKCWKLP